MSEHDVRSNPKFSSEALEEASVWLVILRGPRRTRAVEQGFKRWKKQDASHAAAFEAVTSMWELTERLPRPALSLPPRWKRAGFRTGMLRAAVATAAVAIVGTVAALWYVHSAGVSTGVGEQRMLSLKDGTRVYLNTDTRIVERYTQERRSVELKSGEALFEVAKQPPSWPFVVTAGGTEVTAIGTSFVMRRIDGQVAVTLVEGKVNVYSDEREATNAVARSQVLSPGERAIIKHRRPPQIDRPEIEKVTAWRRGRVELDNMPLSDAVFEMNRYTEKKIRIVEPESGIIVVKGTFRAGDTLSFANSVAVTCALTVVEEIDRILLSGKPSSNCGE